jgi:hypothetical protein
MAFKEFWKAHFVDVIVVGSLTLLSSAAAIYLAIPKNSGDHIADIYRDSTLLQEIDLSKESETERTFVILGYVGEMTIGVKTNAIHVVSSGCPNHYCIYQGWTSDVDHPLVCAYNHVSIQIVGTSQYDVVTK